MENWKISSTFQSSQFTHTPHIAWIFSSSMLFSSFISSCLLSVNSTQPSSSFRESHLPLTLVTYGNRLIDRWKSLNGMTACHLLKVFIEWIAHSWLSLHFNSNSFRSQSSFFCKIFTTTKQQQYTVLPKEDYQVCHSKSKL